MSVASVASMRAWSMTVTVAATRDTGVRRRAYTVIVSRPTSAMTSVGCPVAGIAAAARSKATKHFG